MIAIERDLDFDILIGMFEIPETRGKMNIRSDGRVDFEKPVPLEAIAKPTGRKVFLTYFGDGDPANAGRVRGKIDDHDELHLEFYGYWKDWMGLWTDFEHEAGIGLDYNKNPVEDRYDAENKVAIYSGLNLPGYLKNYFGISE